MDDYVRAGKFDDLMKQHGLSRQFMLSEGYLKLRETFIDKPEIVFGEFLNAEYEHGELLLKELKKYRLCDVGLIKDAEKVDAVLAFNAVINSVQETFGKENMTEAVMCKAIEAASYIGYKAMPQYEGKAAWNASAKKL